jgi:dTDP-4-dehydrorhamnose reductase
MRVLITGAAGQLGQALLQHRPASVGGVPLELIATSREGGEGQLALDLADAAACRAVVEQLRPDWLINAGAYTAVDRAEAESELAWAVNAEAPAAFSQALQTCGGRLLQVSTDFVFSGGQGTPYRPEQPLDPLGVYGASKAAGEQAVLEQLGGEGRAVVLRTGWVYGPVGRNFLLTMLRLHRERAVAGAELAVVADQVGCPTATAGLAEACWQVLRAGVEDGSGAVPSLPLILHWSDAGVASWYDFAVAIGELGVASGLLEQAAPVRPITTADYPTPAQRPSYSLLECSATRTALGLTPQHWRAALASVIRQLSG